MNFYKISKIIPKKGLVAEDKEIVGPYHFDMPRSLRKFKPHKDAGAVFIPQGIRLQKGKDLDDLMNFSIISWPYLVISERFHQLIQAFETPQLNIQSIDVYKDRIPKQYKFIFSPYLETDIIDFKATKFHQIDYGNNREITHLSIASKQELLHLAENTGTLISIGTQHPIFDLTKARYDLFLIHWSCKIMDFVVSERLKKAIENAGLKGISFEKISQQSELT